MTELDIATECPTVDSKVPVNGPPTKSYETVAGTFVGKDDMAGEGDSAVGDGTRLEGAFIDGVLVEGASCGGIVGASTGGCAVGIGVGELATRTEGCNDCYWPILLVIRVNLRDPTHTPHITYRRNIRRDFRLFSQQQRKKDRKHYNGREQRGSADTHAL